MRARLGQCKKKCPECGDQCEQTLGFHKELHHDFYHQWNDKNEIVPEYE